jgi:glycosyltransferase involved in cell wall biosynthesis
LKTIPGNNEIIGYDNFLFPKISVFFAVNNEENISEQPPFEGKQSSNNSTQPNNDNAREERNISFPGRRSRTFSPRNRETDASGMSERDLLLSFTVNTDEKNNEQKYPVVNGTPFSGETAAQESRKDNPAKEELRRERPPREPRPPRPQRPPREQKERDQREQREQQNRRPQEPKERENFREREKERIEREKEKERRQRDSERDGTYVSIVIPCFNEEESLRELSLKIRDALSSYTRYEVIFIDDGSTDGTINVLRSLRGQDKRIKFLRFRRNYGKSAALSVGFNHAQGDVIVTMDSDLQDEPSEIPKLLGKLKDGFDLVSGWKKKRYDPISKTIPSKFFNFITSVLSGLRLHDFNCGLKAYRQEVAKSLEVYGELHRYIPVLAFRNGFKVTEEVVVHRPRKFGKSKFGASRFWRGFFDLLTVLFTTKYFRRPLHFFGSLGAFSAIAGFAINAKLTYDWFFHDEVLNNRPLLFVGILLMIVGVQLFSTGLIGDMIVKTHSASGREYAIREKQL